MLNIPINEQGLGLFLRLIRNFVHSSGHGPKAVALFLLLIALLFGVNGLNILNSYVGRDFMTAISERNMSGYVSEAVLYVMVFAASTAVAVILRFAEERLGLLWRDWMTRGFVDLYLRAPTYYRMNDALLRSSGIEHPDQRIADDVRTFTTTTLSFTLMLMNSVFTIVAFSGVLWSISPALFGVSVAYALAGSFFAVMLGRRLIDLNYDQLDKEAAFRSTLMHVRERAESVALLHREGPLKSRALRQFDQVVANFQKIILVNRNLGFFTTGYNYMVQIIPILLVAPLFIRGDAEFGVITQSAMAFAMLIGAFSLIVTQFQSISSYAAVIQRLLNLWYAIELAQTETVSTLDTHEENDRVAFDHVTLRSPVDGHPLVRDLEVSIPHGTRVIVTGTEEVGKDALFKATAGIVDGATGTVVRPRLDHILFLPERPYIPPGSLREALIPQGAEEAPSDERIAATLQSLGLHEVLERIDGLDTEHDWDSLLSLHEQQLVSFARILLAAPRFAFLDCPNSDLSTGTLRRMLDMLAERNITCLTVDRHCRQVRDGLMDCYDAELELKSGGGWEWRMLQKAA